MARNAGNHGVFHPSPTASGYTKLEEYSPEMGNFDLEVLYIQADFGNVSEVKKVATSIQDRRKKKINNIESRLYHLEGDCASSLAKSANVLYSTLRE